MMEIIIDPACRMLYASYYLVGLRALVGVENVQFSRLPFVDLYAAFSEKKYDHFFAFICVQNGETKKLIIDYHDSAKIDSEAYNWCDLYGKVNYNSQEIGNRYSSKVKALAPGFGVKLFNNTIYAVALGAINYYKGRIYGKVAFKKFIAGYLSRKRLLIDDYEQYRSSAQADYIFLVSTLWSHENAKKGTNPWRYSFMKAADSLESVNFEGGFVVGSSDYDEKYSSFILTGKIGLQEYLSKTQKSALVFNTPAVHNCHGWKLAEYLAMGKAIISTPFQNELPYPLEHGKNIHFVRDENDIQSAISLVLNNIQYRTQLEKGAFEYYKTHIEPVKAIRSLLD